ncbi:hypothetical protein [Anaerobaca lacustris]|uniref:Uncharacterized protein n=1 Tax=Anaerobaca lacustris TaxID=3044600 RepID=A0AAW6TVP4_9BACT|nr:hypothetical protein [Sedimentisphaerales bacterium M17dextr]
MNAIRMLVWSAAVVVVLSVGSVTSAVTVTLTFEDPCSVMGALSNQDGDAYAVVAQGMGGPSKPYISTAFFGGGHSADRRAIAEFALKPMRDVSVDPNAVTSATLRFYFDDVIFPDNSPEPYTTQDFTLELYTETANGRLDGVDANDADATIGGEGPDDWQGRVVQSWRFVAGQVEGLQAGQKIVGMFGPDEPFPAAFDDDTLAIFGMIGFEVDVAEAVRNAIADPDVRYLGFRWICNSEGGYWTSMDPKGYLPSLAVDMVAEEPMVFALQSTDSGPVQGNHAGRPYHIFNDADDEAIYLTVGEWQGGHNPNAVWTWPLADGIISWDVFTDPNGETDRPEVVTYDELGNTLYIYWDSAMEEYALIVDQNSVPDGLEKLYYEAEIADGTLNIGNNGIPPGGYADRQQVLLSEFNLMRPGRYGLDPNHLVSAHLEVTIDRVIDMAHTGNNMALIPSIMYVNAYEADGVLNLFENAQADFERINHEDADAVVWLTIDGSVEGDPITDFALSWYKLVDPGLGEQFTIRIDVTDAVRRMLENGAGYAGFVCSCSPDGEFALASVDLVDTVNGTTYLPRLVLETDLQ